MDTARRTAFKIHIENTMEFCAVQGHKPEHCLFCAGMIVALFGSEAGTRKAR